MSKKIDASKVTIEPWLNPFNDRQEFVIRLEDGSLYRRWIGTDFVLSRWYEAEDAQTFIDNGHLV